MKRAPGGRGTGRNGSRLKRSLNGAAAWDPCNVGPSWLLRPKLLARSPLTRLGQSGAMSDKISDRAEPIASPETKPSAIGSPLRSQQISAVSSARMEAAAAAAAQAAATAEVAINTALVAKTKRGATRPSGSFSYETRSAKRRPPMDKGGARLNISTNVDSGDCRRMPPATGADSNRYGSKQGEPEQSATEMDFIKSTSRTHSWHWEVQDCSHECIVNDDKLEVCFHPQCSESTAAIRGSEPLSRNGNYYYWEVTVLDKAYGTSVMFGVCTKEQRLHTNDYCNLVGLDREGWSLSHKGLIWHNSMMSQYVDPFPANQTVTIGILLNTMRGELSYFMNGKNLGVAFCGLNGVVGDLYPVIGSTAKCTRMRLNGAFCGYVSLMERSCFTILRSARNTVELVKNLHQYQVPKILIKYLAEAAEVCGSQTETTAQIDQSNWNANRTTLIQQGDEQSQVL